MKKYYFSLVVIFLILMESGSYLTLYLIKQDRPYKVYTFPSHMTADIYENIRKRSHPQLGWVAASKDGKPIPRVAESQIYSSPVCVATYGDSFTWGASVENDQSWTNVLSKLLDCQVQNWGVQGYGTGQILKFYEMYGDKVPKVVIFGIWPNDILRGLNHWRYLYSSIPSDAYVFKPRYIVEAGKLKFIPTPVLDFIALQACAAAFKKCLEHEEFLPGKPLGPVDFSVPYTFKLFSLLRSVRFTAVIKRVELWELLLAKDSQAYELTKRLLLRFKELATARKQTPVLLIFPTRRSLTTFRDKGKLATKPFADMARDLGIELVDINAPVLNLVGNDICILFEDELACDGHLSVRGNEYVARILKNRIEDYLVGLNKRHSG